MMVHGKETACYCNFVRKQSKEAPNLHFTLKWYTYVCKFCTLVGRNTCPCPNSRSRLVVLPGTSQDASNSVRSNRPKKARLFLPLRRWKWEDLSFLNRVSVAFCHLQRRFIYFLHSMFEAEPSREQGKKFRSGLIPTLWWGREGENYENINFRHSITWSICDPELVLF